MQKWVGRCGGQCFLRVAVPTGDVPGLTHCPLRDRFSCALLCCHRDPLLGSYKANQSFSSTFSVAGTAVSYKAVSPAFDVAKVKPVLFLRCGGWCCYQTLSWKFESSRCPVGDEKCLRLGPCRAGLGPWTWGAAGTAVICTQRAPNFPQKTCESLGLPAHPPTPGCWGHSSCAAGAYGHPGGLSAVGAAGMLITKTGATVENFWPNYVEF